MTAGEEEKRAERETEEEISGKMCRVDKVRDDKIEKGLKRERKKGSGSCI